MRINTFLVFGFEVFTQLGVSSMGNYLFPGQARIGLKSKTGYASHVLSVACT